MDIRSFLGSAGGKGGASASAAYQKTPAPPIFVDESGLTDGQKLAVDKIRKGETLFCTGAAGTGKSHVGKLARRVLRAQNKRYVVTATTGPAAVLVGGATLHSTLGVGRLDLSIDSHVRIIRRNKFAASAWKADALIVDEISMLSDESFDKLDNIARAVRRRPNDFFGGMQLVLFGDFFQLPPIEGRFVFHSERWKSGVENIVVLTENMRQTSGSEFERCLNKIRVGDVDADVMAFLQGRTELLVAIEERKRAKKRKAEIEAAGGGEVEVGGGEAEVCGGGGGGEADFATEINTVNSISDNINLREYERLDDAANEKTFARRQNLYYPEYASSLENALRKTTMPEVLSLKIGCKVMLRKNLDVAGRLCNGTRGNVVGFSKTGGFPVVKFESGAGRAMETDEGGVVIEPHTSETFHPTAEDLVLYAVTQIPLSLAWALTIHKAQGATLQRVVVDLARTFVAGQAYVAISRCREAGNLTIRNLNARYIFAHADVVAYYRSITQ